MFEMVNDDIQIKYKWTILTFKSNIYQNYCFGLKLEIQTIVKVSPPQPLNLSPNYLAWS